MIIVFLCMTAALASVNPQCSYTCDNPTCDAVCRAECAPPVCSVQCAVGDPNRCSTPSCTINCPNEAEQSKVENCPMCETTCSAPSCPSGHVCSVLCEPTDCSWRCFKPLNCRQPQCQLQCESPACEYVPSNGSTTEGGLVLVAASLIVAALL